MSPADLDEAERLSDQIIGAYALRNHRSAGLATSLDDRHRAYTVLVRAYDQARRAVTYLRWDQGDAELFAPSLWARRKRRRRRANEQPVVDRAQQPEAPAPASATSAARAYGTDAVHAPSLGAAEAPTAPPVSTH